MTDSAHAYWSGYIRSLADDIGLKDWTIELKRDGPANSDAGASMITICGRRIVWIRLGFGFYSGTPEDQRHYVLHELLHVHLDDVDTAIWQAKEIIGSDTFTLMEKVVKDRLEFAIDTIAASIGHAYPVPDSDQRGLGV